MKKDILKRIAVLGITAVMIVTISLVLASQGMDYIGDNHLTPSPTEGYYDPVPPVPIEQSCCVINHWGTISVEENDVQQIFDIQLHSDSPYSIFWITIYCTTGEINVTTYDIDGDPIMPSIKVSATQSTTIHSTAFVESVDVTGKDRYTTSKGYYKISHCCKQPIPTPSQTSDQIYVPIPM